MNFSSDEPDSRYATLEATIGYRFKVIALCESALTHKSWLNETQDRGREDNERLEFLGDAVLGLVVSDLLMKLFSGHAEGELSKIRGAVVNEAGLAKVADSLSLGQWIFLGKGEEQAGGRQRRSILSDAFEALMGAIFLDGGFDETYRVAKILFADALAGAEAVAGRDFKSRLQEVAQGKLRVAPSYLVLSETGPEHNKTFEVAVLLDGKEHGRATGKSKKEAQQSAAAAALAVLETPHDS